MVGNLSADGWLDVLGEWLLNWLVSVCWCVQITETRTCEALVEALVEALFEALEVHKPHKH